jgi:hypothetical protein
MLKILCLFCLLSQSPDGNIIKVIVNPEKDKKTTLLLSDFADEVRYIKLQTSDVCMLEKISKVLTDGDNVFISTSYSNSSRLLFFKSDGLFIREIGQQGRGPGEFSAVLDFDIDRSEKKIFILDSSGNIYVYDYNGKYLQLIKSGTKPARILLSYNELYLFTAWPDYILNKGYAIKTLHLSNENMYGLKLSRKPFSYERKPGTMIYNNFFAGVNEDNSIDFYEDKFDTLYNINSIGKVQPKYIIELKNDLPRNLYTTTDYSRALADHYNTLSNFISTKNYLFFKIITPKPATIFYYSFNKTTKEISMHNVTNDRQYFLNDLDGGYTFRPDGIAEAGVLYSSVDSYKLLDHFSNSFNQAKYMDKAGFETLKKLINSSKVDDNPVIMLVTLK